MTDAHALIWYGMARRRKLGAKARRIYDAAEAGKAAIYVPTFALVETLDAARAGVILLDGGGSAWVRGLLLQGSFFPVDLTAEIVLRAEELSAIRERGDRLIAATAAVLDIPLITRDPEIEQIAGVEVIW